MRTVVGTLFLWLLIFSCKNEEIKVNYLQKEEVQLVQPRIMASSMVIDSFVTIKADRNIDGAEIFYSDDGSEPTRNSTQFIEKIKIKEPKELKFKAFHNNFKASETASIKLYKKGYFASDIKWFTNVNEKYKGVGSFTLINGKKASLEYNNPEWMGFDTIAKAIVKFHKKTHIKSIDIGYLNDPASWIFPPTEIEIIIKNFTVQHFNFRIEPLVEMTNRAMLTFNMPINQEVIALTITLKNVQEIPDWHDGKGNRAWLFMDEWIFN
jgi:hexosaminidase